ncbi:hypothetical protein C8J57DRAFT_120655 [Mycena rebaudengoi]|nr:hypothetical protein C8J57DRAFT_120655 [Mycena rebaudengoi]
MLPREEILSLLRSMGVDLPRKTKLPDAELDKRLSKALDSAQYLTRVVQTPRLDPTSYPAWPKSNKPILEAIRRHNVGEATFIHNSRLRGNNDPYPLFSNAFMDLRQTLMSIGNACDNGMRPVVIQDEGDTSGICMRVLEVRQFDAQTPILILVFSHDVEDALSPASFEWISSYVSAGTATTMLNIRATVSEQQLLLRLLHQNSKRIATTYKPKQRAATESAFTLSFLLPVGPLGAQEMAKYNTNNGCSVCGDPAKQKCSRCSAVRYCDAVCQKEDWKSHRRLCNSLQGAKWQGLTFILADNFAPGNYSLNVSQFDNVQHNDMQQRLDAMIQNHDQGPPPNTHGMTPFVVKVQVKSAATLGPIPTKPEDYGSEMGIYDQRRTMHVRVLRDSSDLSHYEAVVEAVKMKSEGGVKAFLWAIRTGEWTVELCLDQFPEWQKW